MKKNKLVFLFMVLALQNFVFVLEVQSQEIESQEIGGGVIEIVEIGGGVFVAADMVNSRPPGPIEGKGEHSVIEIGGGVFVVADMVNLRPPGPIEGKGGHIGAEFFIDFLNNRDWVDTRIRISGQSLWERYDTVDVMRFHSIPLSEVGLYQFDDYEESEFFFRFSIWSKNRAHPILDWTLVWDM